jgi:hypothetical protein
MHGPVDGIPIKRHDPGVAGTGTTAMKTYPESSRALVLHHAIVLVFVTHRIGKNAIFADDASAGAGKIVRKPKPVALKSISSLYARGARGHRGFSPTAASVHCGRVASAGTVA